MQAPALLNLPQFAFSVRDGKILDPIRKKWLVLTPEEWVRQNFLQYLIHHLGYPEGLIRIEGQISVNTLSKRCDAVIYGRESRPLVIVECKAHSVKITQDVFEQIARYNMTLKVNYLMVTNGMQHYCSYIDHEKKEFRFLPEIPHFSEL